MALAKNVRKRLNFRSLRRLSVHVFDKFVLASMLMSELRGRVKKSLQPSFFSSHGCIYTKVAVSTSITNLYLSCHVTWTVLHTRLYHSISIKTMHFGHHFLLSQIGGKFECEKSTWKHFCKTKQLNDVQFLTIKRP